MGATCRTTATWFRFHRSGLWLTWSNLTNLMSDEFGTHNPSILGVQGFLLASWGQIKSNFSSGRCLLGRKRIKQLWTTGIFFIALICHSCRNHCCFCDLLCSPTCIYLYLGIFICICFNQIWITSSDWTSLFCTGFPWISFAKCLFCIGYVVLVRRKAMTFASPLKKHRVVTRVPLGVAHGSRKHQKHPEIFPSALVAGIPPVDRRHQVPIYTHVAEALGRSVGHLQEVSGWSLVTLEPQRVAPCLFISI